MTLGGYAMGENGDRRPGWELRLLDGWRLTSDGAEAVVSLRERRVLTLLALRGERERSYAAQLLWPHSDEHRALASLRAAVWRIQHQQPGLLEETQHTMSLTRCCAVDVDQFHTAAQQVTKVSLAAPVSETLRVLSRGPLLPGWYDDWVIDEREIIGQLQLIALEMLSEHLLMAGDAAGALGAARTATRIDPLRDSAQRALIRVHIHSGNYVDALRAFLTFRRRLSDELGVCVSPQTLELMEPLFSPTARRSTVLR